MTSSDKHSQLVKSMIKAEEEAQNEESFFLVELVTAATQDETPRYDLREIYEALTDSRAWLLLDPLNLLPLLVPSDKASANDMIQVTSLEGSPKESLIAAQEALERLERAVTLDDDEIQNIDSNHASELVRLIGICENAIPRLALRKKGPSETLQPIVEHLSEVIDSIAPSSSMEIGRNIIFSVCRLIQVTVTWLSRNSVTGESEYKAGIDLLIELLYTTLSACAQHIRANLAQRQFEESNPKLVFRSAIYPESEGGMKVAKEAVDVSRLLGITFETLVTFPITIDKLILLAHGYAASHPHNISYLHNLSPVMTSAIQKNMAMDESLTLLLTFLSSSKEILPEELVNSFAALLTPLASTHPDAPTRHLAFRILSLVLSHAPPPVHMAHLSSLLTDCPFPQMRVASVGLVKEAFLNAINLNYKSPFTSPSLIRAFGPALFRPSPPDLFSTLTDDSLKSFLQSSEPPRLTECLAFYYVLLKRDVNNSSGIKDRDVLKTVENGLLAPLRNALAMWLGDASSVEDPHALMPLASLETSLERVDGAIRSLQNSGL